MNPFDLSGPEFLVFYICVALMVIIALKLAIDEAEGGAPRALPLSDPYQIAWLRGGTPEAARIAVLSLIVDMSQAASCTLSTVPLWRNWITPEPGT